MRLNLFLRIFFASAILAAAAAESPPPPPEDIVPAAVREMIRASGIPPHRIGIVAREAGKEDAPLISYNANRFYNPASVVKLITAYAALDLLGPNFRWKTVFAGDGGGLFFKGGGDPYITMERFLGMLNDLRGRGIKRIDSFAVDDSIFNLPPHDSAAFDGAPLQPYNAGPGGAVINFKATQVILSPDGKSVLARTNPPSDAVRIENKLRLDSARCRYWRGRFRERIIESDEEGGGVILRLSGRYSRRCGERDWHLNLLDHSTYAAGVFGALWRRLGGEFSGEWRRGITPQGAKVIAEFESPPLSEILRAMNKYSNNLMARQVFLTLGKESKSAPPYNLDDARKTAMDWLSARGIKVGDDFFIDNGSGLSRATRVSPNLLADILDDAWTHPWRAEFLASLPLAGVDGTMRRRLRAPNLRGRARLKSGSLSGVKSLAGYVRDASGRDWIVVCVVNWRDGWRSRRLIDRLLIWLANSKG